MQVNGLETPLFSLRERVGVRVRGERMRPPVMAERKPSPCPLPEGEGFQM